MLKAIKLFVAEVLNCVSGIVEHARQGLDKIVAWLKAEEPVVAAKVESAVAAVVADVKKV